MAQEDAFRRRKLNFNEDETEILIREVTLHQDQLFGRGETKLPPGTKNKVWLSILAKVNAVSKCTRDIGDIKKRWYDMCHRTKDKVIKLAQEALRGEGAVTGTPPPRRQKEEEEEEEDKPTSVSLGHPGTSGGEDGAEPSTSGASQDGSTGTASSRHAAPSQQAKTPALPLQVAWHGRQVPPMLSHQSGVQWPPVLLFTLGQNATRVSTQERPPNYQAGNTFDETTVKVKQEDISPNFDADYSSPDIASPTNLQEQSSFRPQGKRLHKQISDEEFFGIQEQHNVLLGDGNKELHGIRQELRELRSDLQELAAGIRQPLERLADYIQALLPLLQHPPRSRMMEMTNSFTQPDEEETVGSGSSLPQSRRTACKTCKRPKLGM